MKLTLAALTACLISGAAFAGGYAQPVADPIIVEPPMPSEQSAWDGFYLGGQYGTGSLDFSYAGYSEDFDADAYGVHAGYLRDLGQWVIGVELDYNNLELDDADIDGNGDMTRLRARAGYDFGKVLPYVSLGTAWISTKDSDGAEVGVTYGVGVDFMPFNDKFSVGLEYSRQDFNDIDGIDGLDLTADMFQLRAAYRF
ncbi:MAG: outer membrane protein [Paracoccus sp. (in: a-proteobacteria)]